MQSDSEKNSQAKCPKGRFVGFCLFTLVVFALDLITKELVITKFAYGEFYPVTSFFNLCHVRNTGAAFSFLSNAGGWQSTLFVALALALSVVLLVWLWRERNSTSFALPLSLSLVLAGALGNCLDRVMRGSVVDFLDFYIGAWHWPAFNVADIAICLGAAILIFSELFSKRAD